MNEVWIDYNSFILGGVIIGDGAVIGANSLLTQSSLDKIRTKLDEIDIFIFQ